MPSRRFGRGGGATAVTAGVTDAPDVGGAALAATVARGPADAGGEIVAAASRGDGDVHATTPNNRTEDLTTRADRAIQSHTP
jgi:hypothetical protein